MEGREKALERETAGCRCYEGRKGEMKWGKWFNLKLGKEENIKGEELEEMNNTEDV